MGVVDKNDQLKSYYEIVVNSKKWWPRILYMILWTDASSMHIFWNMNHLITQSVHSSLFVLTWLDSWLMTSQVGWQQPEDHWNYHQGLQKGTFQVFFQQMGRMWGCNEGVTSSRRSQPTGVKTDVGLYPAIIAHDPEFFCKQIVLMLQCCPNIAKSCVLLLWE